MTNTTTKSVAIVTGASSGIGKSCAEILATNGFSVVLAARSENELNELHQAITAKGGDALVIATDLADKDQTHALIEKTIEHYGRIDTLVNNAGYSPAAALEQLSRDELRHVIEVNLLALMQLTSEVIPIMRQQGSGRIIQMGSLTSRVSAPLACPYAATKGAIEALANCLRLELMPWNIHVSLVLPGFIDTPTFDKSRASGEALRNDANNPYQRLMFSLDEFSRNQNAEPPERVAEAVLDAATSCKPRAFYFIPFSSRIIAAILAPLPAQYRDKLLDAIYGLSKLLKTAKGNW